MIGRKLSHYEVTARLGEGGMGVVWKARDLRLQRDVAVKVLPPGVLDDPERRQRFQQEARVAAAINHPNIATVFETGEDGDTVFLIMELVEGETLRRFLPRAQKDVREQLRLAIEIADGLQAAHRAGVVHRDLKPENVMIRSDGRIKILDFGLAKFREEQVRGSQVDLSSMGTKDVYLTLPGHIVGSAHYMSPEQARGLPVDPRTDIFSMGTLLYEMATGTTPFEGRTPVDIISAVLSQPVAPAGSRNPEVPADMERILARALEKDPDLRYQSAADLLADLKRLKRELESSATREAVPGASPMRSVAVLPFADMSPARDQDYFCEGIAEEIINALTALEGLKVASRTSSFQYKGKTADVRKIGRDLGVEMVLEGSIRTAKDRLRVTGQLISVKDGYHIWSEKYDRSPDDVFAIQDEISSAIADALKMHLVREGQGPTKRRHTPSADAYDHYLRARYYWNQRKHSLLSKSMEYFQKAIDADPAYALAYSGLADAHSILGYYGYEAPRKAFARGREYALRAIEIDPEQAEPHASLGYVQHHHDWDPKRAEASYRRAIELNGKYPAARQWYAVLLASQGRFDEAFSEIRHGQESDPLSLVTNTAVGWVQFIAGRPEEALVQLRRTLELDSGFPWLLNMLGWSSEVTGRLEDAVRYHRSAVERSGESNYFVADLGYCLARAGDRDGARAILDRFEEMSRTQYVSSMHRATVFAGLEEREETLKWLEAAREERAATLVYLRTDPRFQRLREDPRFVAIVAATEGKDAAVS